jgi:hypothetical protein
VLALAARAVAARLNADDADDVGPTRPCPQCQQPARYAGRRRKTLESVLGPLTLTRAYYHCAACGTGACPRDHALGIADTPLSPGVTRMVGAVGARVSFVEGHTLLHDLAGVAVDPKQVERTAEALGRTIAEDERTVVEAQPPAASTMYLGMDGTGLPMRAAALAGRRGKQADGTAKTREVKLCTVWTAEARDAEGRPVRDPGSVSYSAAIESAAATAGPAARSSPFALRVDREAQRRGFDQAARRVALGDGAVWIWHIADEACPGAIQIVDLFHAKQHLSEVAAALHGPGTPETHACAHAWHAALEAGHLRALVRALRRHAATSPAAALCLGYLVRNRQRMRYPAFRAQGLCVTSGVVEAGCKVAIGTRLKRAGMHWTVAGADAIIALRCCVLSGRFEDFWERRAAHQRAA